MRSSGDLTNLNPSAHRHNTTRRDHLEQNYIDCDLANVNKNGSAGHKNKELRRTRSSETPTRLDERVGQAPIQLGLGVSVQRRSHPCLG